MPSIILLLLNVINTEEEDSVNYKIAHYLLNNTSSFKSFSTSSIAEGCNVSKATISRFCKKIGVESFYELKYMFQDRKSDLEEKYGLVAGHENSPSYFINQAINSMNLLKENLDIYLLSNLIEDIFKYKKVAMFGHMQSGSIAISMQHELFSSGKMVDTRIPFMAQKKYIEESTEENLIIAFSSSGTYFSRIFQNEEFFNKSNAAKIYLITTSSIKKPSYIDHVIALPNNNMLESSLILECYAKLIALKYFEYVNKKSK